MNPDAAAGVNFGLTGPHPDKDDPPRAYDVKEAHRLLNWFHDDDLKQIVILPPGSRLRSEATYLNLRDRASGPFTASADMTVGAEDLIVPKREVDYQLWNRLIGVTDPARTGKVNPE